MSSLYGEKLLNAWSNKDPLCGIESKILFKIAVTQVIIEVSSVCNRRCSYCPHSLLKRPKVCFSEELLDNLLCNLSSINYSGSICLNLYNEPLVYFDDLVSKIMKIKATLPAAKIFFSTNGDYLTAESLRQLKEVGLGSLFVTVHPQNAECWDTEEIKSLVAKKAALLNLDEGKWAVSPDQSVHCDLLLEKMPIQIFSLNFLKVGVNRAGSLTVIEHAQSAKRTRPCTRPLHDFCISYDGSVYPCCQFFHGLDAHRKFIIGNIRDSSIFSLFVAQRMRRFRKMAFPEGAKAKPCDTCTE